MRGRWQPLRDLPLVLWLVAAVVVAGVHRWVPEATWLMVHLVLLGAVSHAVMVWSAHFARTLLRAAESPRSRWAEQIRLLGFGFGALLVLIGVPTAIWALTFAGAVVASGAVVWHGVVLYRMLRRALPGRFRVTIRYYRLAAALLPLGAGFGATLAYGLDDRWHARFLLAHTQTMLLGWLGLTVVGTLVTFWPTVLRTRMDDRAERLARQAMPLLLAGITVVLGGALCGLTPVLLVGVAAYLAGLVWVGRSLLVPLRRRPPQEFAGWSILAAMLWFVIGLVSTAIAVAVLTPQQLTNNFPTLAGIWVVGFALQLTDESRHRDAVHRDDRGRDAVGVDHLRALVRDGERPQPPLRDGLHLPGEVEQVQ